MIVPTGADARAGSFDGGLLSVSAPVAVGVDVGVFVESVDDGGTFLSGRGRGILTLICAETSADGAGQNVAAAIPQSK
jgi:hypothetical protein